MLLLLLVTGVAGVVQAQRIVFTPGWTPQSQFAGYYVAMEKGFYREAGVEVEIKHPSASYSAFNRLFEGSADIITLQLLQAMVEIDRGMPLVNILQTSQHNSLLVVSRRDSIRKLEDLRGKKVGIWKAGFGELGQMLDIEYGLNIEWIPFLQQVNLYVSGAVDATLAMGYNEHLQIIAAGFGDSPVIRFADYGYDFPEDGVYVTTDFYRRYPEQVEAFARASCKGWEWAHRHPEEALEIVMKMVRQENVATNPIHQRWMLEETLRLQCDTQGGTPSFQLNPEKVNALSDFLLKHRRIRRPVSSEKLKGGSK